MPLNASDKKVFVIGLDGATIDLVKAWANEGHLPVLAGIMREGVYGHLETVPNQNSAPAWTSFMTGKNPAKHGIYYFYEKRDEDYKIRYVNGGDRKSESVWGLLGRAGKKVVVLNVPMTYPAEEVNGILVAGMDAPGKESKGFTYPPDIVKELEDNVPGYMIEPGITSFVGAERYDLAVEMSIRSIKERVVAIKYLMERYLWDFFMVVFRETDVIQHHFWKFMEKSEPERSTSGNGGFHNVIFDTYRRLDEEIGKITSTLGEDCYVIIMSDHGFSRAEGGPPYLNHLLRHIGMLKFQDESGGFGGRLRHGKHQLAGKVISILHHHTSRKSKERLLRLFPSLRDRLDADKCFGNIDWSKTKAFAESSRIEIWINLKDREPAGTVEAGSEYDSICNEIKRRLYQWHDPASGKRVVKRVFRREEVYHGEFSGKAPDLLVIFNDDVVVTGIMLVDEQGGKEHVAVPQGVADILKVNGAHRDNGIFLMKGKGIRKGYEMNGARIIDLAPTILYLMHQGVVSDMDGKVLIGALTMEMMDDNPVRFIKPPDGTVSGPRPADMDDSERDAIEQRLRGLGYIE